VQEFEAGGYRGYLRDRLEAKDLGLLAALRLVAHRVELPLVAAGGIADGAAVAAVLCAGAGAAQIGSALMLTPEAGTSALHREALRFPGLHVSPVRSADARRGGSSIASWRSTARRRHLRIPTTTT
jgi:nitronate monooxygenase